jgi:putative FmdB family regulatory protein
MPTYEFKCNKCNQVVTKFYLRKNDIKLIDCENDNCDGFAGRIISPVAVIFNGSGFSITDKRKELEEAKTPI